MLKLANSIFFTVIIGASGLIPMYAVAGQTTRIPASTDPVFLAIPNDPDYSKQDYLNRIHASTAWDILRDHTQQQDVIVAVIDTGVDIDHPDLNGSIWKNAGEVPGDGIDNDDNSYIDDIHGWDFLNSVPDPRPKFDSGYTYDAINHGTVLAGIIAAQTNNTIGIVGAGRGVTIMPLRVFDGMGSGNTTLLIQAIDYAIENGADVINLSLVGDTRDPDLVTTISRAYRAGVAVVSAAGNQETTGIDLDVSPRYPVCESQGLNHSLGVAAVDAGNARAPFSNFGANCIDIAAPGTLFYGLAWHTETNPAFSAYYRGGVSGTSVAAPLVSATIAMIKKIAPNISVADEYRAVLSSATSLESTNSNYRALGFGMLDSGGALKKALEYSRQNPLRIVMAQGKGFEPKVYVKDKQGVALGEFFAYSSGFRGGVSVAIGDVDGDGAQDIVTAPLSGGGPHVRIFDIRGKLKRQFMAYGGSFRGGLSVALGDMNGDGSDEIITAPLSGGGPHVKVFDSAGKIQGQFMAYDPSFRGGVSLVVGDLDNDRVDEIITAPASKGGPHIRIFAADFTLRSQFMAFDSETRGGYSVAAGDIDGDGEGDIAVMPETDQNVQVRIYSARGQEKNRFLLYPDDPLKDQASSLLIGDYTGDGQVDIATYPLTFGTQLSLFDYYGHGFETFDFGGATKETRAIRFSFAFGK